MRCFVHKQTKNLQLNFGLMCNEFTILKFLTFSLVTPTKDLFLIYTKRRKDFCRFEELIKYYLLKFDKLLT